jgi:hypothetical protein
MLGKSRAGLLVVVPLLTCACHSRSSVPISPNTSGPLPAHSTVVLIIGVVVLGFVGLLVALSEFQ